MSRLKLSLPDEIGVTRDRPMRQLDDREQVVRKRLGSPEARRCGTTPTIVRWLDNWAPSDER